MMFSKCSSVVHLNILKTSWYIFGNVFNYYLLCIGKLKFLIPICNSKIIEACVKIVTTFIRHI